MGRLGLGGVLGALAARTAASREGCAENPRQRDAYPGPKPCHEAVPFSL
ncbi:hypothetical protein SFR_0877 [Streptomyces sp. FR-008]|nr:hypothetical protein SFR_0877 [Streptomyces sp. FR-008]